MSDELQLSGWDTTRALCEADPIERELRLNTGADDDSQVELVLPYATNTTNVYHFPSEERLATANAGYSTSESIDSGAVLIGVEDNSWTELTGDLDLQTVLDEIDTKLAALSGATDAILKSGTPNMEADWTCDKKVTLPRDLGDEMLTDPGFPSGSVGVGKSWQISGEVTDGTNKLTYTQGSTDTGYFTQTAYDAGAGNMVSDVVEDAVYYLQFVVSNYSGSGYAKAVITSDWTGLLGGAFGNYISGNDTIRIFFKATATIATPKDFKVTLTTLSGTGFSFDIDDVTLTKYEGGWLKPHMLDVGNIAMGGVRFLSDITNDEGEDNLNIIVNECTTMRISGKDGVTAMKFQGENIVDFFHDAYEGLTPQIRLSGQRAADSARTLVMSIDDSVDDQVIFENVSNYKFDGKLKAASALLSGLAGSGNKFLQTDNNGDITAPADAVDIETGTFKGQATGISGASELDIHYIKMGSLCVLLFPWGFSGANNSTNAYTIACAATATPMPATITPSTTQSRIMAWLWDAGSEQSDCYFSLGSGKILYGSRGGSQTGFTVDTNTKGFAGSTLMYYID